mgnify:CR=1 FL=1
MVRVRAQRNATEPAKVEERVQNKVEERKRRRDACKKKDWKSYSPPLVIERRAQKLHEKL